MVQTRNDVVGLDSAIIMNPRVWEASLHTENFTDPLAECKDVIKDLEPTIWKTKASVRNAKEN